MSASLVLHTKEIRENEIVEIKIWKVARTMDKPHGVKISIKGARVAPSPGKAVRASLSRGRSRYCHGHQPMGISVYIKEGRRLLGYDNAEGKGYHRHFMNREEEYHFSDIWMLLEDFKKDLTMLRGRNWDEG